MVKSSKKALYRTRSETSRTSRYLKENELRTLMTEVTGFLNSRPLTYESSDVNELRALTPNHFILQRSSVSVPQGDFSNPYPRDHYNFVQHIADRVWDRFVKEYLPSQMNRKKGRINQRNLQAGDVVLVADPNLSRAR